MPDASTNDGVEGRVGIEEASDVPGVGELHELVVQPPELVEVGRGQARDGEPHGHDLERLAHLVGLDELVMRQRADDSAAPWTHEHEPFGGEPDDRLADRPAADAELARKGDLGELGAGRQAIREDLLAKMLVHPLPEGEIL